MIFLNQIMARSENALIYFYLRTETYRAAMERNVGTHPCRHMEVIHHFHVLAGECDASEVNIILCARETGLSTKNWGGSGARGPNKSLQYPHKSTKNGLLTAVERE
jgi:hypothetical protein